MRRTRFLMAAAGLTVTSTMLWATGCTGDSEGLLGGLVIPFEPAGTTIKLTCKDDPITKPDEIRDDCAIFVRGDASDTDESGSQAKPFKTLQGAIKAAADNSKWVIACAKNTFTEAVNANIQQTGIVPVYGGFDCSGIKWTAPKPSPDGARTTLKALADAIPLTLTHGQATDLSFVMMNFAIEAADATKEGGSSIAVIVNDPRIKATFKNCTLTSGNAKDASDRSDVPTSMGGLKGTDGAVGSGACDLGATHAGGALPPKMCPNGTNNVSQAGKGGDGDVGTATSGVDGNATPAPSAPSPDAGKGGTGEGVNAALKCANGNDGGDGTPGDVGLGGTEIGSISGAGYVGTSGGPGLPGTPGSGGGGGGGAKGSTVAICSMKQVSVPGASGGSGGTGGCGGLGGGGGKPGGSSIALLNIDASVILMDTTLQSGRGGNGGKGGLGEQGGGGGKGGDASEGATPAKPSCRGGYGGTGGNGGAGGGGQGGHSLAIAINGGTVIGGTIPSSETRQPGLGGTAGDGSMAKGKGADGHAVDCLDFGSKTDSNDCKR